jgi:Subtilase family
MIGRGRIKGMVGMAGAALVMAMATTAGAADGDQIVRTKALNGLPIVNGLCRILGCSVLGSLDTLPGDTQQQSSLFLVRGLLDNTVNSLLSLLGLATIEPDLPVALVQDDWGSAQASAAVVDQLWDRTPATYYGTTAWESYLQQKANDIVRLREAHCSLRSTGAGIVAVIDTGVDGQHPTLQPVLLKGYDFTRNVADGSEPWASGQASAAVVDGVQWVNPSTAAAVDQASAAVVDDPDHHAYGHGTMVAGVVHLVAPTAKILPVRAFGSDGQGSTSDILRAIYFSVNRGAKVLNMSFSRTTPSAELKLALDYANLRGVIAVSSAGNNGNTTLTYPAAYDNVIGVASTSDEDTRSSFSSYGARIVSLAAPGEGIITPYPGGGFAAAWGTSFSTPYVAGAASLLAGMQPSATPSQVASAIAHAKKLTPELGSGRLDLYQTVLAGRAMWPRGSTSAVPQTCDSDDVDWTDAPR